jgi:hypothetical protein
MKKAFLPGLVVISLMLGAQLICLSGMTIETSPPSEDLLKTTAGRMIG